LPQRGALLVFTREFEFVLAKVEVSGYATPLGGLFAGAQA
jgi:hypothetical protein